ncbi:hypothetical protein ABEX55_22880 [Priestia endophytica]|uniref:hypothetical protein n=1 Tax=Priestia endophytica TaxID=135735 RepID=UPI003D2C0202
MHYYQYHQPLGILGIRWIEQEHGWTGVWTRRGSSNVFDARWTKPGQIDVTAVLTISVSDNRYVTIERRNSSDGVNCNYTGTISSDGTTVTGNYSCTPSGGGAWSAKIHRLPTLGKRWIEREGFFDGVWTRRGDSNIFDATWKYYRVGGPQLPITITAVLTIHMVDRNVTIERRNSSDGVNCNYTGIVEEDGMTVRGNYSCTPSGGGAWSAYIHQY